jgi:hypothetical protein
MVLGIQLFLRFIDFKNQLAVFDPLTWLSI